MLNRAAIILRALNSEEKLSIRLGERHKYRHKGIHGLPKEYLNKNSQM